MKIELILIDDHQMILEGLTALFSQHKNIHILAKLSSLEAVQEFISRYTPPPVAEIMRSETATIAICDLSFSSASPEDSGENAGGKEAGFEIIKVLNAANKNIQCIVYSMHSSAFYIKTALSKEVGAVGYILKDADSKILLDAVKSVAAGNIFLQKEVSQTMHNASTISQFFTKKERLVAEQLLKRLSNEEIAEQMKISKRTVENYITSLYDKTGTSNRQQLVDVLNGSVF